jgi:hypothetical protein
MEIPIIDLIPFFSDDPRERKQVASQWGNAFETIGFATTRSAARENPKRARREGYGMAQTGMPEISFETDPSRYRHLRLAAEGDRARIILKVDEGGGLRQDYQLKLNFYDLGVYIKLADAVNRLLCLLKI